MREPRGSAPPPTRGPFSRIGALSERYAGWVVAAWVLLAGAMMLTAPALADVGVTDDSAFLPSEAPSQQADAVLQRLFPDDPTRDAAIVVVSRKGGLTDEDHTWLASLTEHLQADREHVVQVQSGASSPDLAPFLGSADGEAELVIVGMRHAPFTPQANAAVERLREVLEEGAPDGLEHHVTGIAGLAVDQANAIVDSFDRTAIVTVVLVLGILVWVYRSAITPFVPLLTIGVAFLVSRGVIGFLAQAGFKVSGMVDTFLVVMVFGAGTDYCLFIASRYRQDLGPDEPPWQTLRRTMTVIGAVIAASAVTVIVGFLSQLTAQFGVYRTMGPAIGVAIAITLVAALTLTPALLRLAGRRAFWPATLDEIAAEDKASPRWLRVAAGVTRRPSHALLAGVIVLLIPAAGLGWFRQSFDLVGDLPSGADARSGFETLAEHFPGGRISPIYVIVESPAPILDDTRLSAVDRLTDQLRATRGIGEVRSVTQPAGEPITADNLDSLTAGAAIDLAALPPGIDVADLTARVSSPEGLRLDATLINAVPGMRDRLGFLLGADERSTRLVVSLEGNPYEPEALDVFHRIDDVTAATLDGTGLDGGRFVLAGPTSFYADMQDIGARDFRVITAALLAGIFAVLALLLRSLVAPFYLLATVVLSYAATMGLSVLVFRNLFDSPGISFWLPPFLFIILVALGADYNIFIMSRIREEAEAGHDIPTAVARGLCLTGHTITSAGIILAGTFLALLAAPLPNLRQIGFAVTVGVLIDTFIVRSVLVPAATVLLGRWAFWPGRLALHDQQPLRRRHIGLAAVGLTAFVAALLALALTAPSRQPITEPKPVTLTAARPSG